MTEAPDKPDNTGIVPAGTERSLAKRSVAIARRGLDLALSLSQPRLVHFPENRSVGTLSIRDHGDDGDDWRELGAARGVVTIPPNQDLYLMSGDLTEGVDALAPLTALAPQDLYSLGLWGPVDETAVGVSAASFAHLKHLTGLRWLHLSHVENAGAGLAHLKSLTGLQGLSLFHTKVSNSGVAHVKHLTGLRELYLTGGADVTDAGLVHLKGLTGLRLLELDGTQVTDTGLAWLQAALPDCEIWLA